VDYKKYAILLAMLVFLVVSITPAKVSAGKKMKKRVEALEGQVGDHEDRIGDLEQQTQAAGIKVKDNSGNYLGILLGHRIYTADSGYPYWIQIFVPSLKKSINISPEDGDVVPYINIVYSEPGCDGDGYIQEQQVNDLIFKDYKGEFYTCDTMATPMIFAWESIGIYSPYGGSCSLCQNPPCSTFGYPVIPVPAGTLPFRSNADIPLHYEY